MKKAILTGLILITVYVLIRIVGDLAYQQGRASYAAEAERVERDSLARGVESFVDHSEIRP